MLCFSRTLRISSLLLYSDLKFASESRFASQGVHPRGPEPSVHPEQHRNAVTYVLNICQLMAAHDNRLALCLQAKNQIFHFASTQGSRPRGWFIKQHKLRIVDQGWASPITSCHPLEYSFNCRRRAFPVPHFDQLIRATNSIRRRHVEQTAIKVESFVSIENR